MVHFVREDIQECLPNTHPWQPRETELAVQGVVTQLFHIHQRPLVNQLHRLKQRPLRLELFGGGRPALGRTRETGKVVRLAPEGVTDQLRQSTYARLGAKIERRIGQATDGLLEPGMQGFPQGNDFPDLSAGRVPAFLSHLYFTKPKIF